MVHAKVTVVAYTEVAVVSNEQAISMGTKAVTEYTGQLLQVLL